MALRVATLKWASSRTGCTLGCLRQWAHAIALPPPPPPPLSTTINHASSPLGFPEHQYRNEIENVFPNWSFLGGSMELMAVPKRKVSSHKRGIRNGPNASCRFPSDHPLNGRSSSLSLWRKWRNPWTPVAKMEEMVAAATSPCSLSKSSASILSESSISSIPHNELTIYKEEPCIALSDNEIQKLSASYKYILIGKFSNGMPLLAQVRPTFDFLGFKGAFTVGLIDSKHVLIIFTLEEDYIRLFLNPIWCVCGYPMKVFKWTINFNPSVECAIVPVWISLPNLLMNSFEKSVLFSIVSEIGTHLMMDEAPANQSIVSNARVCVELDLRLPRIHRIRIGTEEYSFWQEVVFENIPTNCSLCLHQGHTVHECSLFDKMIKRIISATAISDKECNKNENTSREKEREELSSSFVEKKDDISQADSFSNGNQSRDLEIDSRSRRTFSSASARTNRTKRRRERKRMREGGRKGKSTTTTLVLWEKPRAGFVKLNTDGCLKRSKIRNGESAGGGILRDHEGEVLFAFHEYYGTSSCSALAAELKALLAGLKICLERGYKNIWVELDAGAAVKRISHPATDLHPGRTRKVQYLVDEVRRVSSYLNVHYTNIYRQANSAADILANEGFRTKERRIMEENELPVDLKEILRLESLNTPYVRKLRVKDSR